MVTQSQVSPAPFDTVASHYDDVFTSSVIGRTQRAAVWKQLAKAFHPGDRVLEIGCGTGVDACYLGKLGVEVLACDPSPRMIDIAGRRIRCGDLQALVRTRTLRAEDVSSLPEDDKFDGVFSNFGALNCVEDLQPVAQGMARLLRPGAIALLCWMSPCCLWETLFYLGQGNPGKAFRRFRRVGVNARVGDAELLVHYPSSRKLACAFAPQFRVQLVQGVGVSVPPSYLESWAQRHPRAIRFCEHFDSMFAHWPGIRSIGDHVLVKLQRTPYE